ncbi:ATPase family AAA domain-containing protein 5 isoform X2 [Ceratitis capitata]|nr:ATPase family AAA domain-containing protein 5 isoform X2 [Ceratitis capitata]XP_020716245.1 ATPase family AAA domain-containing protein 5 isoform X2 [Ceratitis capitata]CAD7003734.1 unnamed protein product [Ceratitis capitata]
MEEVLNSVKKKHRQKHKKKREQKKLAEMEAAAEAVAAAEILNSVEREDHVEDAYSSGSDTRKNFKSQNDKILLGQHLKTKPLQEKKVQENGQEDSKRTGRGKQTTDKRSPLKKSPAFDKSPLKGGTSANGNILRHFQRTPKKHQQHSEQNEKVLEVNATRKTNSSAVNQPKTMNAFEVMMNARNKTIGSNTPGKELSPTMNQESTVNTKRRLMLQEWSDKVGGTKRKLEEEKREAYIVDQLDNRAKRFKHMLEHGGSSKQTDTPTQNKQRKPRKADTTSTATKQNIEKPKRRKRTAMRLDSIDSVDDNEEITKIDAETAEFLSKLNSPTKKRDSLLGYFPRKESPTEIASKSGKEPLLTTQEDCISETKKHRTRRSSKNSVGINTVPSTDTATPVREEGTSSSATGTENTPSGRPKRSCAGKARYDYDLDVSPTKTASIKKPISKVKNDESKIELEIINLDDSNMSLSPEKVAKKLAPLFVRAVPKPSPDPVILKARQDFLMSGVPEKMRLEMEKQKQYEQTYDEELDHFPRICHVPELSLNDKIFLQNKRDFTLKLRPLEDAIDSSKAKYDSPQIKYSKSEKRRSRSSVGSSIKMQTILNVNLEPKKFAKPSMPLLSTIDNKRDIIKLWKGDFDRFPTFKCYNQMREKYRFFSALDSAQDMEQVSESFVVTRRTQRKRNLETAASNTEQDDVKPPATAPNGELLFTEKYKPMLVEQVLVNLVPVTQLRDFLATWANGNGGSARNSQTFDDSCDASNDSNCSLSGTTCNAVVLLGPVSSGKTNAVYALANDMNFNVLEINAGMKRTGKRLIQELQEATQSHQIRKDSTPTQSASKAQKNLLRMSLNGKKVKQNSHSTNEGDNSGNGNGDTVQNTRKCLILIEDADVVFDQLDSGFIDAIYTLAASSKRPVIVMATNPNCMHLQRLMNQNTIYFTPPNALNISRFMAVLSLIENCPINLDDLVSLYLYNGKDLRRTLLELQFFIQSGGDRKSITENDIKIQSQQRTPQKDTVAKRDLNFFASPTKRRLSVEERSQQPQEPDEQLRRDRLNADGSSKRSPTNEVYVHRSLFEFFTLNQNKKWRIPFPVDFRLLRVNLADIFHCSQRLLAASAIENDIKIENNHGVEKSEATKRRTRTPKVPTKVPVNDVKKSSLEVISDFYENISIAALLGSHNADMSEGYTNTAGGKMSRRNTDLGVDRLLPHMSEHIAHELVEQAISVNLAADTCPYNLFDTPTERLSLCDYINSNAISARSQRTRAMDLEPALRAICRSEKHRAMQERRSTRFYHYLRHSAINASSFSTELFGNACSILLDTTATELHPGEELKTEVDK